MTLALLILVAVGLSLWRASHGRQHGRPASEPSRREREVGALRDRYLAGEIELQEFESQVADALVARPVEPTQYAERWEIHVHDAPPGHSLHIHLP